LLLRQKADRQVLIPTGKLQSAVLNAAAKAGVKKAIEKKKSGFFRQT